MLHFESEALSRLALTPAVANAAAQFLAGESRDLQLMRITEVHRGLVTVHDGWQERSARVLLRVARNLTEEGTSLAVGDWVLVGPDAVGDPWVEHRIPPATHVARRDGDGVCHPIVSNVDTALLVMGLDDDFNPRRLERFIALAAANHVVPVVVLTKLDVSGPEVGATLVDGLRKRIPAVVDMMAVDATDPATAVILRPYVGARQTLVLLGSSGAGKSTLTNTLMGDCIQDTGPVRSHDSRGKHTTTSRSLHFLPGGACIIDTPGLRTLRPDGDESALSGVFADIAHHATLCRFRDCKHAQEPGCAVRDAIDPDRVRNYHKLLREARRDTLTALDKQRRLSEWKARSRVTRERMKAKRG